MSDVYIPGVQSRFNSDKLIEDLMKVERIPKERAEKNIENLQNEKGYWQEVGRRISTLRESARALFSFQNPFGERQAISADESVISASATREASEQELNFTVKQTAQADRFLSRPLDEKHRIESGTYTFSVGEDEISFTFRGGTLKEFADALNRRGRDKISASIFTVEPGTKSLLIESKVQGSANRLGFSADARQMAIDLGMAEAGNDSRRTIAVNESTVRKNLREESGEVIVKDGVVEAQAGASVSIPFSLAVAPGSPLVLKFETATKVKSDDEIAVPQPPPGPSVPSSGAVSYGGIVVENDPSNAPLPQWTPPPLPERHDSLSVLRLSFSDGTTAALPAIGDSGDFTSRQINLGDFAGGKTITALSIENDNTHRDISLRNIEALDPTAITGGLKPLNAVSTAQDAILAMEGIEMRRPSNIIDDIIPGVTVTLRGVSDRPVNLKIQPDREAVKESLISLVGNYNRLMTELNVLTRSDPRIIDEISYLSTEEKDEMKKRQNVFSSDSTLNQFKNRLLQAATASYPTSEERNLAMLAQIGIGTNLRSSNGGYDPSRLRGYLEIDEKALDAALETRMSAVKELFGNDTTGDALIDTGVAFTLDAAAKPFVEMGGLISLKTGTIDSRISQDQRRIESMERQLAAKEVDLRIQYGRMEGAYSRMEQMSSSLDNFSQRNNNGR